MGIDQSSGRATQELLSPFKAKPRGLRTYQDSSRGAKKIPHRLLRPSHPQYGPTMLSIDSSSHDNFGCDKWCQGIFLDPQTYLLGSFWRFCVLILRTFSGPGSHV